MSDFDESTERLCVDLTVERYNQESMKLYSPQTSGMLQVAHASGVMSGRNSAKESLEIACRALEHIENGCLVPPDGGSPNLYDYMDAAREAIAKIREQNNWPVAEREGGKNG